MLVIVLLVTLTILSAALLCGQIYLARKVSKMSDSTEAFAELSKDVAEAKTELFAKNAKIAELETAGAIKDAALAASEAKAADLQVQLTAALAAAGTPAADIAALDAELKPALDPAAAPAPAPEPTPETPPAAT
jgi:chromosome segregation ATPase